MKQTLVGTVLLLLAACDPFSTSNATVDEGMEHYTAGRYDESVQSFETARDEVPERSELFYDLGTAQIALGKFAEAETSLVRALEIAGDDLRPLIWANLGHARLKNALATTDETQRKELLTKAVDALGKAVLLRSDLEGARRDLELALLHLYPPCEKREDKLEPNDSAAKASDGSALGEEPLMLCPGNHDWFTWKTEAGDRIEIAVEPAGEAPTGPPAASLFDASGAVVATTVPDKPQGEAPPAALIRHTAPTAGTFNLDVFETDDEEHPYRVRTTILPACERLQDTFEPNNDRDHASPVDLHKLADQKEQAPGMKLRICPGDEDWFRFSLNQHESLLLQLVYEPVEGDLALEILDASGAVVARGMATQAPQQAGPQQQSSQGPQSAGPPGQGRPKALAATLLDVPADGEWFLRVRGTDDKSEAQGQVMAVVRPPCPQGDDELEENDSRDAPSPLTSPGDPTGAAPGSSAQTGTAAGTGAQPGPAPQAGGPQAAAPQGPAPQGPASQAGGAPQFEKLLRRCPGDDDWFQLDLKKDQSVEVSASFEHAKGDLALELYEDKGDKPVLESNKSGPAQNGEGIRIAADQDKRYLLRVTGAPDATNFYMLKVAPPSPDKDQDKKDQDKKDQDKKDQDKKDQDKKDQDKKDQEPQKKPIEQMMDQMDQQKQRNLEAEKALRNLPNARVPGGKPW